VIASHSDDCVRHRATEEEEEAAGTRNRIRPLVTDDSKNSKLSFGDDAIEPI
jgi:hypothetical protein